MRKIKKYRRIPEIIEAVEFRTEDDEWPNGVALDGELNTFVWNDLHKTYIKVRDGDFIRMDKPNDRYPIDRKTFFQTYEFWNDK